MATSAVVGFLSVLIGRWLHLDYSAKLWAMTFVLVVMVSARRTRRCIQASSTLQCLTRPLCT